ncbi:MAG: dihydrofolate reductase [Oscillospiraceae bacterium]|nr:dihydrofolate reductase [Oscillospiraceae bacterium]
MNAIVAVSENWGIGYRNQLLFHISPDMRRFQAITLGKTVILGRKTLESLPGGVPLSGRETILLSTTPGIQVKGALICKNVEELLECAKGRDPDSLFVIGGASVYQALLSHCRRVFVTQVKARPDADRFFPDLDALPDWEQEEAGLWEVFESLTYRYLTYRRADAACLLGK